MTAKTKLAIAYVTAAAAAAFGIFQLPYFIRSTHEVYISDSLRFGFNNRVSVIAVVISVVVFYLLAGRLSPETRRMLTASVAEERTPGDGVTRRALLGMFVLYVLFVTLSYLVNSDGLPPSGDYQYFLYRTHLTLLGKTPYSDFEYFYGPALLYPAAWLQKVIAPGSPRLDAGYYVCLGAFCLIGLGLLAFVLNSIKLPPKLRNWLFVVLGLAAVPGNLGLGYPLLRFLVAPASLLLLHRVLSNANCAGTRRLILALLVPAGAVWVGFLVSPEMGVATGAACIVYSLWAGWRGDRRFLAGLVGVAAGCGVVFLTSPSGLLASTVSFGAGYDNKPVVPAAYILIYLGALLLAVPLMLRPPRNGGVCVAGANASLAALCLAMAPAALGLCDSRHVLYNGMVALILGAAALSQLKGKYAQAYVVCILVVFLGTRASNDMLWYGRTEAMNAIDAILRTDWVSTDRLVSLATALHKNPDRVLARRRRLQTVADFSVLDKYPSVGTPMGADEPLVQRLVSTGRWHPDFYDGTTNIVGPSDLSRKLAAVLAERVIVVRAESLEGQQAPPDVTGSWRRLSLMYLYPYRAPLRSVQVRPSDVVRYLIERHFRQVDAFRIPVGGSFVDYKVLTRVDGATAKENNGGGEGSRSEPR